MSFRPERPIPNRKNELRATYRSKVETRPMTPEEYRRYFGTEPPIRKSRRKAGGKR
mgnify:CR=1 FL=1